MTPAPRLLQGDCLDVMRAGTAESIDAIVTDPPYGLGFMGKEWDALPPGDAFAREALRVLKPGGHLLAFGGTRTYHRLVVALEDAGFEIRDCIAWMYGTGFPKSRNIGDGWGTALKPAFEPIVVARKPLSEKTVAANVQRWGTGALNIDGTRIETDWETDPPRRGWQGGNTGPGTLYQEREVNGGRWPANVALDEDAAAMLDEQSGELKPPGGAVRQESFTPTFGGFGSKSGPQYLNESGGASRFFYVAKASRKERNMGLDAMPEAFAGPERENGKLPLVTTPQKNDHPTVKPVALMQWLVRLVTPPGGRVLDPFMGSGTTGIACALEGVGFVGIELDQHYHDIASARIAAAQEGTT